MAHKAIREYFGKRMLSRLLLENGGANVISPNRCVQITEDCDWSELATTHPWLLNERLVVKPDQLIKRRGNNNLIALNVSLDEARKWISAHMGRELILDGIVGELKTFIVEPFVSHGSEDEYYFCIQSRRSVDEIYFFEEGGVDVGDVDSRAKRITVGLREELDKAALCKVLLSEIPEERRQVVGEALFSVYQVFKSAGFVYLEVNPAVYKDGKLCLLDVAAKLDDTAEFECGHLWGEAPFSSPFGRELSEQERYISRLDAKSGASLKFVLLNPRGRVWTMVAGGGASVVYADTVGDLGFGSELANYGEYSGNPTDEETYEYAKSVLELMTAEKDSEGREKILLIGGGIANFTDVAKTFRGLTKAIREKSDLLKAVNTKIYVRRGGPNYREGLNCMEELGKELNIPVEVFGPDTHMTKIVGMALVN